MNTPGLSENVGLVFTLKHAAKIKLSQLRGKTPTQVSQDWPVFKVRKRIIFVLTRYACIKNIKAQVKKNKNKNLNNLTRT